MIRLDLTGRVFGKLTALKFKEIRNGSTYWEFLCECGTLKDVSVGKIKNKKSCGCHKRKKVVEKETKRHGLSKTKEYRTYISMKARCLNETHKSWDRYGGRGIKICERWLGKNGFVNFFNDMGKSPSSEHSLDRIDNGSGYSPDNCRWATRKIQQNNTSKNVLIEYNGDKKSMKDWSVLLNIPLPIIISRYYHSGFRGKKLLHNKNYHTGEKFGECSKK